MCLVEGIVTTVYHCNHRHNQGVQHLQYSPNLPRALPCSPFAFGPHAYPMSRQSLVYVVTVDCPFQKCLQIESYSMLSFISEFFGLAQVFLSFIHVVTHTNPSFFFFFLSRIPLYEFTTIGLFICLYGHLGCFQFYHCIVFYHMDIYQIVYSLTYRCITLLKCQLPFSPVFWFEE